MELRCKSDGCKSSRIYGPCDRRFLCLDCGRIYVTPDVPIRALRVPPTASTKLRLALESRPECLGNHDSACDICTNCCAVIDECRKRSGPADSDFYSHTVSEAQEQPITCPTCGELDRGRYCSSCGNPLQKERRHRAFPVRVLHEALINDWLAYGRTIATLLISPRTFFSAVFSAQSAAYHHEQGTLVPAKFFLRNITLAGVLTILVEIFLAPETLGLEMVGPMGRLLNLLERAVFDVLLYLASVYVPAVLLLVTLPQPVTDQLWPKRAHMTVDDTNRLLDNLLVALTYLMALELPALPGLVWLSSNEFDVDTAWVFPVLLLNMVAKVAIYRWLLPQALRFACRVPEAKARAAAYGLFLIFLFLGALLSPIQSCVAS